MDASKHAEKVRKSKMHDLVQNDVEERVIATQYAFDVAAGVHFKGESLLHI